MKNKKPTPQDNPPWMDLAWHEYLLWSENVWTVNRPGGYHRAQCYINITGEHFSPQAAGWCGCFVDWVLKRTNRIFGTAFSTVTNNPSGSQNYATRKRYPGSVRICPRLTRAPYGSLVVLQYSGWQGHIGFLINCRKTDGKRYVCLLAGNQNGKVCVQEFFVYRQGGKIYYKTRRGKIFTLKGFVFPKEYDLKAQGEKAFEYCTEGYTVEELIETFEND